MIAANKTPHPNVPWKATGEASSPLKGLTALSHKYDLPAKFAGKVAVPTDCLQWVGAVSSNGYGSVSVGGIVKSAHVVAWEHVNGAIPSGLQIDHLCRNRACVNVDHMELVPGAENTRRQPRVLRFGGECANGHPIKSDADIYVRPSGVRECRTCRRGRAARRPQGRLVTKKAQAAS